MREQLTIATLKDRLRERLLNAPPLWREQWHEGLLCLHDQADALFREMGQTIEQPTDFELAAGLETVGLREVLCHLVMEVADEDIPDAWWRTPEWVARQHAQAMQEAAEAGHSHNLHAPFPGPRWLPLDWNYGRYT